MKYKLVLTSMVMGAIVCSTSAVVGAANVAPQVSDTAKHDAVQSTWKDRTDIKLGMQFSRSSSFHEGLSLMELIIILFAQKLIIKIYLKCM